MGNKFIGKRISQYREKKGYTQEIFAEKVGISTSYLSAVERGIKFPRLDNLIAIINELDCSADEIFIDVINRGYDVKTSKLAEKIDGLSDTDKSRIFAVIDALIKEADGK